MVNLKSMNTTYLISVSDEMDVNFYIKNIVKQRGKNNEKICRRLLWNEDLLHGT